MKKIIVLLIAITIGVIFILSRSNIKEFTVVVSGNLEKKPLEVKLGKTLCSDCGMMVRSLKYSSQVIGPDGTTWFFDDLGCMARWLSRQTKEFRKRAVIWVYTKDSKRYILASKANYTRDETTPIGYGFGAYERKFDGSISFDELLKYSMRGETYLNPFVKKLLSIDFRNNWLEYEE